MSAAEESAGRGPSDRLRRIAARSAALLDEALLAECEVERFTAGGPGGQHRNKTASGIRLRHGPTGFVISATERRSQHQNQDVALARLRRKLVRAAVPPKPRVATKPSAGAERRRLEGKRLQSSKKRERQVQDD